MRHPAALGVCLFGLLSVHGWSSSEADLAVVRQMRVHAARAKHARVFHRSPVDADFDAVFALAGPTDLLGAGDSGPWEREIKLGIFVQQRTDPGLIYKIVVADAPPIGGSTVRVERVTSSEAVISCTAEKGNGVEYYKFLYDRRAKALVAEFSFQSFPMSYVLISGTRAVLLGWDLQRPVAIEYVTGTEPPFRILSAAETQAAIRKVPASRARDSFIGSTELPRFAPVRFGPSGRFALNRRTVKVRDNHVEKQAIEERTAKTIKWFDLPQSTYDEFSAARPSRVKDGYARADTFIDEGIGSWQIVDGTLWFGKGFCDAEGTTGVGGFGYFDTESRGYVIHSPEQVRDYSVSAILVESDSVWLALERGGEWGSTGAGVVRFSRSGQLLDRIPIAEVVGGIARVDDQLLMATAYGAAIFDGRQLRRFMVDQTRSGRLRVVEGTPVKNTRAE